MQSVGAAQGRTPVGGGWDRECGIVFSIWEIIHLACRVQLLPLALDLCDQRELSLLDGVAVSVPEVSGEVIFLDQVDHCFDISSRLTEVVWRSIRCGEAGYQW